DHSTFDVFAAAFDGYRGHFESAEDQLEASLYFEARTFLHGLLVVEDKLSMAHSLETRVPFLDDDLVEFALRLPAVMKLRAAAGPFSIDENTIGKRKLFEREHAEGKPLLRTVTSRFLPEAVAKRAKQGFSAPDASWFRGESIDYINRLLGAS